MKKIISALLTLLMCISLVVPAAALDNSPETDPEEYSVLSDLTLKSRGSDSDIAATAAELTLDPAVKLSDELLQYTGYSRTLSDNPDVIPYEKNNCVYFVSKSKIYRFSPKTQKYVCVAQLPSVRMTDRYNAGDRLIYLESVWNGEKYNNYLTTFSFDNERFSEPIALPTDYTYSAVGTDGEGRYLLYATDSDKNKLVQLVSAQGDIISSSAAPNTIYSFLGIDKNSGNFYTLGYMNWVYYGYDHDVDVVYPGNLKDDVITFSNRSITMTGQMYFSDRYRQAEFVDGRYLVTDKTIYQNISIYDMKDFDMNGTSISVAHSALREKNGSFDSAEAIGTRTAYIGNDSFVINEGDSDLVEYSMINGEEICRLTADHPIFMLMKYNNSVIAIEKDDDGFYFQMIPWKSASTLIVTPKKPVIDTGATLKLKADTDAFAAQKYTWSSSDPKVVSINDEGEIFGRSGGTAVITVKTATGLSAEVEVTVNETRNLTQSPFRTKSFSQTTALNLSRNNYTTWASPMKSFISENADGTLSCVSSNNDAVYIDTYDVSTEKFISRKTVSAELPLFGGYYSSDKYNYLVFGADNLDCSDDVEVMRVVRYTKNWQKSGSIPIKAVNTYRPFDAGSLRMEEVNGKLYIYTCHEMYTTSDGLNHQANMIFVINEDTLTVEEKLYDVSYYTTDGYVSHSFNQFIKSDGKNIYRADHGDANPRGIIISKSDVDGSVADTKYTIPVTFNRSAQNYNYTGASVGGMELSTDNVLIAGNIDDNLTDSDTGRRIFVTVTDKSFQKMRNVWINDKPESGVTVNTPQMVKIADDQFLIMWEESEYNSTTHKRDYKTKLVTIDANGSLTSDIVTSNLRLSDCQPILCKDKTVRWYVSDGKTTTVNTVSPLCIEMKLIGDVNDDGAVDALDATLVQRIATRFSVPYTDEMMMRGDIDGDGELGIVDATFIQRFATRAAVPYPIGEYAV